MSELLGTAFWVQINASMNSQWKYSPECLLPEVVHSGLELGQWTFCSGGTHSLPPFLAPLSFLLPFFSPFLPPSLPHSFTFFLSLCPSSLPPTLPPSIPSLAPSLTLSFLPLSSSWPLSPSLLHSLFPSLPPRLYAQRVSVWSTNLFCSEAIDSSFSAVQTSHRVRYSGARPKPKKQDRLSAWGPHCITWSNYCRVL